MEQALLCSVAAAARAAAFLDRPDAQDRDLEPRHPVFAAFRRMTYLWHEGPALMPIGDRLRLWLDYLRSQGTTRVRLRVERRAAVVMTDPPASEWRVAEESGALRMLGTPAAPGVRPVPEAADAGRTLGHAIGVALLRATAQRREELSRAQAILRSSDDGSEVSDVAWPYCLMPERGSTVLQRRLLAAAVTAWPGSDDDELDEAAAAAIMGAVNSIAARQPLK